MIKNYKDLYKELIDKKGIEDQLGYFYEEIGELLQAINKHKRANGRITTFDILNEIVDVQITLDILKIGYGMTPNLYSDIMYIKIENIKKILKSEPFTQE